MRSQARTQSRKSSLPCEKRPKGVLQTYIANLKCSEFSPPEVGGSACDARQGTKLSKVCWLVRIGTKLFCRLAASVRVNYER